MNGLDATQAHREIDHTYAFIKTGAGNRYLQYAATWGGFYIGFEGFPLELANGTYDQAVAKHMGPKRFPKRAYFDPLREIYRMSLPEWRSKVRLAVWNRASSCLEIWAATDQLQPFPRAFLANLFDDCKNPAALENSAEWRKQLTNLDDEVSVSGPAEYTKVLDHLSGPSGCRFLPAKRLGEPVPSEAIYAPIDTLSVLQTLNRRTFFYMTDLNPSGMPWPEGIFQGTTAFRGPRGLVAETGYGRYVREYLDGVIEATGKSTLESLSIDQRMMLVCATLNPMLVETAAMLFALDIGMVIDSGRGKGRQGIDVVAVCGTQTTADHVISKLKELGFSLNGAATEYLRKNGTISFQCKGYSGDGLNAARLVEFRPIFSAETNERGVIALQRVLALARKPKDSGFHNLNAWLNRMCDIVVRRQ